MAPVFLYSGSRLSFIYTVPNPPIKCALVIIWLIVGLPS